MVNIIEKFRNEDDEKGVGYIVEAFVAALILFIFVVSHQAHSPETRDWSNFQQQVSANDLTYVMQKTGHTEKMISRGQTGSLQAAFSGVTDDRMKVSGTVKDTPIGESTIGFYTPDSDIHEEDLVQVSSGDRCNGELTEIQDSSEYEVLRTQSGGLESIHDVRIYVTDTDPEHSSGFNGEKDYDTFWVDNGSTCQFSSSEGPHNLDEYVLWGDTTDSEPDRVYDMKAVDSTNQRLTVYDASIPRKIKEELGRSSNKLNVRAEMDSFNFPENDLDYDLIIFSSQEGLDALNDNEDQILEFNEDNSVLLMANLDENDLDSGYLDRTGLKWVDLPRTNDNNEVAFTAYPVSEKLREYLRSLNCDNCNLDLQPGGKVTSSNSDHFMGERQLLIGAFSSYDASSWNVETESMQEAESRPGLPESHEYCGSTSATLDFPAEPGSETDTESIEVYNTQLGSSEVCRGIRGISIDLNDDGDFNDDREGTYVDGDQLRVNQRVYEVSTEGSSGVSFEFLGSSEIEFINYRTNFPDHSIHRFARLHDVSESGLGDGEAKAVSATSLWLLEDDTVFGGTPETDISTTALGSIKDKAHIPYKIHLRWSN